MPLAALCLVSLIPAANAVQFYVDAGGKVDSNGTRQDSVSDEMLQRGTTERVKLEMASDAALSSTVVKEARPKVLSNGRVAAQKASDSLDDTYEGLTVDEEVSFGVQSNSSSLASLYTRKAGCEPWQCQQACRQVKDECGMPYCDEAGWDRYLTCARTHMNGFPDCGAKVMRVGCMYCAMIPFYGWFYTSWRCEQYVQHIGPLTLLSKRSESRHSTVSETVEDATLSKCSA
jgi:hypothetical protein